MLSVLSILYFQDYREKEAVQRNARKLSGTNVYLQNDYCADTVRKRKLLWASAKDDKGEGKRISLVNDKLRIDDQLYAWDDATMTRKAIPSKNAPLSQS